MAVNLQDRRKLVRSLWQFAAVSQFLHTFYPQLKLDHFDTDELEGALVDPAEGQERLVDLHMRLLSKLYRMRHITRDNWEQYAHTACLEHDHELAEQPFEAVDGAAENIAYDEMALRRRVLLLHGLCEWQLDNAEKFFGGAAPSETAAAAWRVEPAGADAYGNVFWLLDDNRLYKETRYRPKQGKGGRARPRPRAAPRTAAELDAAGIAAADETGWAVVCSTRHEWETFPEAFRQSKNAAERALGRFLADEARPAILAFFDARDAELARQLAVQNRKRSSRLLSIESQREEREQGERRQRESELAVRRERERVETERRELQEEEDRKNARERRLREREARAEAERDARIQAQLDRERRAARRLLGSPDSSDAGADDVIDVVDVSGGSARKRAKFSQMPLAENVPSATESEWEFNCECGVQGHNVDDGLPMLRCERCGVWAHIHCALGKSRPQDVTADERAKRERRKWWCVACKALRKVERAERKVLRKAAAAAAGDATGLFPAAVSSVVPPGVSSGVRPAAPGFFPYAMPLALNQIALAAAAPLPAMAASLAPPLAAPLAPLAAPKAAPIPVPQATPLAAPLAPPMPAPVVAPLAAPLAAPVAAPRPPPLPVPLAAPLAAPMPAPVVAPLAAPLAAPRPAPLPTPMAPLDAVPKPGIPTIAPAAAATEKVATEKAATEKAATEKAATETTQ